MYRQSFRIHHFSCLQQKCSRARDHLPEPCAHLVTGTPHVRHHPGVRHQDQIKIIKNHEISSKKHGKSRPGATGRYDIIREFGIKMDQKMKSAYSELINSRKQLEAQVGLRSSADRARYRVIRGKYRCFGALIPSGRIQSRRSRMKKIRSDGVDGGTKMSAADPRRFRML